MKLAKFIRQSRTEIVNFHFNGSALALKDVLAARLAAKHCVAAPHGCLQLSPFLSRRTRLAGLLCDTVIVGSSALREILLNTGISAAKIKLFPIGVPPPKVVLTRADARARFAIAPDAFVVMCAARLVKMKGVDLLISALERVADSRRPIQLLVVGDGAERQALEGDARRRLGDRARFLGFLDDPDSVYPAADILALATRMEGTPLVPKEAAHFAVPSVVADVGGVCDALADGETGILVPLEDVSALAGAIQRLVDDEELRKRLGENAKIRVERKFSEPAMLRNYAEILRGN